MAWHMRAENLSRRLSRAMTFAILPRHCLSPWWPMSCGCGGSGGYADQSIILDNQLHLFDTGLGQTGRKMGEILTTWRNECGKQKTP